METCVEMDNIIERDSWQHGTQRAAPNLVDVLERVLDKGLVIAGDIKINLLDIELLTIKLRLLVVSVDKAREMGINWWEHDPALCQPRSKKRSARLPARKERPLREIRQPEIAGIRGQR
jgi:hypothetical protein